MTYLFKLARRTALGRALALAALTALSACHTDELTDPTAASDPVSTSTPTAVAVTPSFASSFRGGIPFGTSAMPTSEFGDLYNGAFRNIWPKFLLGELAEIKRRGGKVVLMFAGNEEHYKDADGHFDMAKWKARVDRFRGVDFSSFINDGTIVGHYLIDEPYDPFNWHGRPVPGSVVEEMAKYSKQLWPTMTTIVRAQPDQVKWSGTYRYLDAAWAQYTYQKGDVGDYIRRHVADAQAMGLGLVVGLNITKGSPTKGQMTASQIEQYGSALLSSTYPCAFISWQYNESHLGRSDVKAAMGRLAQKAANRASRTCSGGTIQPPPPPTLPGLSGITLKAVRQVQGDRQMVVLTWSGAQGANIDLHRNGAYLRTTVNDGRGISVVRKPGTYAYQVCETKTTRCSNRASATIR